MEDEPTQTPEWPEKRITSWREFQDFIAKTEAHWPNTDRCLFRGHASSSWTLLPSLARDLTGKNFDWFAIARLEQELLKQFRQEAHRSLSEVILPARNFALDWWTIMQHYGAPTRVLDWSRSPYVALYFAVDREWTEDGALWWFSASAAENLMVRRLGATYNDLSKSLFERGDDSSLWDGPSPQSALFSFELKRTLDRIGNQQAFFTVCIDAASDHADVLAELANYGDGPHLGKLIIPRDCKSTFLRELQLMNVTGKSMFPGLDGLGRTLAELTKLSLSFGMP
jgi:hypothetical protein